MEPYDTRENVHYDAFISYRHSELDQAVAKELHRKIERFRLPVNLRKDYPKDRWGIKRVFRDQDELPLASNLSDPIEEALKNTDWLVVICTPRLPESKWCRKEIETFKALHGQDHILAILAEGEPDESFPKEIRFREKTVKNESGETVTIEEEVEPLAADVRESDPRKRSKLIDDAVLRLAAPMYGLGYDDLKQRHREQRIKRIALISTICAMVFFVFGMCCMALSMKINEQKKTIERQHTELQEQYLLSQKKYEESMTLVSDKLGKSGRMLDSVYAIRSAMPSSITENEELYSASAQLALTDALGVYYTDMLIPAEMTALPDDDFWSDAGEYGYLEAYLGGKQILCAEEFDEEHVLIVTTDCSLYLFEPDSGLMLDYTATWLPETPDEYIMGAAYKEDTLYIQFADSDYMAVYRWKNRVEYVSAGNLDHSDYLSSRKPIMEDNAPVLSDDGRYELYTTDNHTIVFREKGSETPVRTLYDMHGSFTGMKKLEGTEYYVLEAYNRSHLLNGQLEVIAMIPGFYDYSPDKRSFILYRNSEFSDYDNLIYMPLLEYDELIAEADRLLDGYEPSDEIKDRYRMFGMGE